MSYTAYAASLPSVTEQSDRLRQARIAAGFAGPQEAAERFHWNVNTYKSNENGNASFSFKRAKLYADKLGVRPEWLYDGSGEMIAAPGAGGPELRPITRYVPLVGVVQAGLWQEVMPDEFAPEEFLPIDLQGFEGAQLFALRVSGPSMNNYYAEGTQVVVCPAAEIGIRDGDHVIVRRRKNGLVETTLKEVVQEPDGIALWPRSSDPRYQEPLRVQALRDTDDSLEIVGVVVAFYAVRPMRARPLIQL